MEEINGKEWPSIEDDQGLLQFVSSLKDNLNAEVTLGTVTNVKEACAWLGYTYLFIRMKMNPLVYGIGWDEVARFEEQLLKEIELSKKLETGIMISQRALFFRFSTKQKIAVFGLNKFIAEIAGGKNLRYRN
ncbi:hypothetical protein CTI12_AA570910 [Artemisia annua]|uniref:MER3 helicase-like winged helix domain-containing protein n=1 Tax=Artemisia annua TaxID=35608 RepID=A0A2U1KRU0_ARTAN|nr:hypothetical protein CTI12_AA570910 [Artemisia annua]